MKNKLNGTHIMYSIGFNVLMILAWMFGDLDWIHVIILLCLIGGMINFWLYKIYELISNDKNKKE